MPRRKYELSTVEMHVILEHGRRHGYLKFKDTSRGEGLRYLILAIERVLLDRENEELAIRLSELQMEARGKEIRKLG